MRTRVSGSKIHFSFSDNTTNDLCLYLLSLTNLLAKFSLYLGGAFMIFEATALADSNVFDERRELERR